MHAYRYLFFFCYIDTRGKKTAEHARITTTCLRSQSITFRIVIRGLPRTTGYHIYAYNT